MTPIFPQILFLDICSLYISVCMIVSNSFAWIASHMYAGFRLHTFSEALLVALMLCVLVTSERKKAWRREMVIENCSPSERFLLLFSYVSATSTMWISQFKSQFRISCLTSMSLWASDILFMHSKSLSCFATP